MPRWSSPLLTKDGRKLPSHGAKVVRWIERNLVYGEGDYYGQPVRLRPWQRRWIWRLYEYYPETGLRRYARALEGLAKGNGKSPKASFVGGYEFAGGVNVSPHVMIGAASLRQANVVFGDLKAAVMQSPTLADHVLPFELELQLVGEAGLAERLAAEAGTNDGARGTCFIADELHEWLARVARLFVVVDGAVVKRRNGFSYAITTAGVITTPPSLAQEMYEYGVKVATGEIVDDKFLFEWSEADPELDLDDEQQLLKAIRQANPAAGDFLSLDNLLYRYRTMPRYEFERYHLNRWTSSSVQWLPAGAWDECESPGTIAEKAPVRLAFKGSYANDRAALVAGDDSGRIEVLMWLEADGLGGVVAADEVDAEVAKAFERFTVRRMACVRTGWHQQIETWAERYGEEIVVQYPLGPTRRADACSKFFTAVVNRAVHHDGNPVLARQLSEATVKNTERGAYIVEDAGRALEVAMCAVMVVDQQDAVEPEPEPAPFYVY